MLKTKQAQSMALGIVISAAILLFLLVLLLAYLGKIPSWLSPLSDCEKRGGSCTEAPNGNCPANYFHELGAKCKDDKTCCMPYEPAAGEIERFTAEQRKNILYALTLTLDNNPNPVSELNLRVGKTYFLNLKINDKIPLKDKKGKDILGPLIVYFINSKEPEKRYRLTSDGVLEQVPMVITSEGKPAPQYTEGVEVFKDTTALRLLNMKFSPSLKDSYKSITMYVVLVDKSKWISARNPENGEAQNINLEYDYGKILASKDYWLASKSYPIKVESVLQISGVSPNWGSEDQLTLTCKNMDCSDMGVTLINAYEKSSFDDIVDKCEELGKDNAQKPSDEEGNPFSSKLFNIVGTTIESSGIDLNLDFGGYRIPTSSEKLKYIVQEKQIMPVKGKAEIKIDKATIFKNFYPRAEPENKNYLLIGENAYVCARANIGTKNEKVYTYGVSQMPLKVDVIPPDVPEEDIRVIYPDPISNDPSSSYSTRYPSIKNLAYFYDDYPKVVIGTCQDFGQSGCVSYDYYIKTGNFINLELNTDSMSTAITGIMIQESVNALFNYLAAKDPLRTICPYEHSNEFRMNTQPEIRFKSSGQGIVCIRIKDKAGNSVMRWKQLWTPEQVYNKIAREAVAIGVTTVASAVT